MWFLGVDFKGVAKTGEPCEWRAPIRVRLDVKRVSSGYRLSLMAIPRAAAIRATFDGSDPKAGAEVPHGEMDAPAGARQVRVVAEVGGQFSQEETRRSRPAWTIRRPGTAATKPALKPDAPADDDLAFRAEGYGGGLLGSRSAGKNPRREGVRRHGRV